MKQVAFTRMEDGTREDYEFLGRMEDRYNADLADRVLEHLARLDEGVTGYRVSRLTHSLQCATRAFRDGAVHFCHHYDQNSFDPHYDTLPLDFFRPMVERMLSGPGRFHLDVPRSAADVRI